MSNMSNIDEFIAELEEAEEGEKVSAIVQLVEFSARTLLPLYVVVIGVIALLSHQSYLFTFVAVPLVGVFVAVLYFGSMILVGFVFAAYRKLRGW